MNTNTRLYEAIRSVVENDDQLSSEATTDIDKTVAKLFLDDFEKCGIHLDDEKVVSAPQVHLKCTLHSVFLSSYIYTRYFVSVEVEVCTVI